MPASLTLSQIRATPLGQTPTYEEMIALIDHVIQNQADIGALSGGGSPGWNSSIDTRWSHPETSASATAYTIAMPDASGEALYTGASIIVYDINQANTGAATLNVGSTDGAVTIKKINPTTGALIDLIANDLLPNKPAWLFFFGGFWIYINSSDIAGIYSTANEWTETQNFNATTVTDGGTINWNLQTNQVTKITISGNRTMAAPTNMKDGAFYALKVVQDGTGSRTLTWNAVFKWIGGEAPTLSTAGGSVDHFIFRCDGTNMEEVGRSLNIA